VFTASFAIKPEENVSARCDGSILAKRIRYNASKKRFTTTSTNVHLDFFERNHTRVAVAARARQRPLDENCSASYRSASFIRTTSTCLGNRLIEPSKSAATCSATCLRTCVKNCRALRPLLVAKPNLALSPVLSQSSHCLIRIPCNNHEISEISGSRFKHSFTSRCIDELQSFFDAGPSNNQIIA
jgi:hypothetical protein